MATTTTQTNYNNNFDIAKFFEVVKDAPAGTRLYLAQVLLDNASQMMNRQQRELRSQVEDLVDELQTVRDARKKYYDQLERSTNVKG